MLAFIKQQWGRILLFLSRQAPAYSLKVVGIAGHPRNKNIEIKYQVCGKSALIQERLDKLVPEMISISGFSKEDSKLILDLFIAEHCAHKLKIQEITFSDGEVTIEVEDLINNYTMKMDPKAIFESHDLVKQFDPSELLAIYHFLVESKIKNNEKLIMENKQIKKQGDLHIVRKDVG